MRVLQTRTRDGKREAKEGAAAAHGRQGHGFSRSEEGCVCVGGWESEREGQARVQWSAYRRSLSLPPCPPQASLLLSPPTHHDSNGTTMLLPTSCPFSHPGETRFGVARIHSSASFAGSCSRPW